MARSLRLLTGNLQTYMHSQGREISLRPFAALLESFSMNEMQPIDEILCLSGQSIRASFDGLFRKRN